MKVNHSPSNRFLPSTHFSFGPTHLQTLPSLNFTNHLHYAINRTTITRTEHGQTKIGHSLWSSALLSDPFSSGIVSFTITVLSIPDGSFRFGLMDSNNSIPKTDETLGGDVKNSVGLNRYGYIKFNTPSSISSRYCLSRLHEGDCVRMEVDLDSAPRTVQFFVNGETGRSYVSGIPSSVRIGFSLFGEGTSFRIDNISRLSQPTPISEGMNEVKW